LTICQRDAAAGCYAKTLAAYLRWLAAQYETVQANLKNEVRTLRDAVLKTAHRRTPDIIANLAAGLRYFFSFAVEAGAITQEQAKAFWSHSWNALLEAAQRQEPHQVANEPARRFFELLNAAIASGRAHVANKEGREPRQPEAWSWRKVTAGLGDAQREGWQPKGERIGWLDEKNLYLEPDISFAVAQKLAKDEGDSLPISLPTLRRRLKEQKFLASWDQARETLTVRRILEGRTRNVLHTTSEIFFTAGLSPDTQPDKPDIIPFHDGEKGDSGEKIREGSDTPLDNPTNPTVDPTSENQAESNSCAGDVGNVGLSVGGAEFHEHSTDAAGMNGNPTGTNVGLSQNENPTAMGATSHDLGVDWMEKEERLAIQAEAQLRDDDVCFEEENE
jgi:hypothetical protein